MTRWNVTAALLVVASIGLYLAFTWAFPTGTIRYRLTVEVEVDGDIRSGSSVVQIEYRPGGQMIETRQTAEAAVVDLGAPGLLFLLLDGMRGGNYRATPSTIPIKEFGIANNIGSLTTEDLRWMWNIEARAEIPFERLPLFARFGDPLDPSTAERVDPERFSEAFGSHVRLVRVTIETTHDPVTTGIVYRLPWLTDYEQATVAWRAIIKDIEGWGSYEPPRLFKRD